MSTAPDAIINRFFKAIEAGDIDGMANYYAENVKVWHSHTKIALDKAPAVDVLRNLLQVASPKYHIHERVIAGNRIIQRHSLQLTLRANQAVHSLDAAIFFTVENGLIQEIHEYIDSGEQKALRAAIAAALS